MPLKSLIFDLDGTLLDTLQDLTASVNYALSRHNMPQRQAVEVRRFLGNGVKRLMASAVPDGEQNPHFEAAFADFKEYYVRHCLDLTRPYDGIPELLTTLHANGYKMAIVSNKLQAGVTELHQRFFADTIDVAIGERDGIRRKPAPDMVIEAMRQLGVQPDLYIHFTTSTIFSLNAN